MTLGGGAVKLAYGMGAGAGIGTLPWGIGAIHRATVRFEIPLNRVKTRIYELQDQIGPVRYGLWYILCTHNLTYAIIH